MWFAYVERSMAWFDLDVKEVHRLIAQNKKGEKIPALEDLHVPDIPIKSVDLIQENNMDRFENKNRNSNKNQNRKKNPNQKANPNQKPNPNQRPNPNQKTAQKSPDNRGVEGNSNPSEKNQNPNPKNPNQKPFKPKKKFTPKRDDNA